MSTTTHFFNELLSSFSTIKFMDVVDILVVALLFYKVIMLVRGTKASRIAKSIVLVLVLTWLTSLLHMYSLNFILGKILELGFIAIVIVFQPELRRLLEKVGSKSVRELLGTKQEARSIDMAVEATVRACEVMSREKIGVLIVFERDMLLDEYFKTGTVIDAQASEQLLRSLFFPNSALHDGAVIIRGGRVAAAGCVLPLSENTHLSSDLGTRHRAGIGMSEVSDAVVVIVSEETGTISFAVGGMLKRHLAPQMLERLLINELIPGRNEKKPAGLVERIRKRVTKRDGKNEK